MRKVFLLFPVIILSGCAMFNTPAPIRHKFPEVPVELLKTCPDLQLAGETEKLSDLLKSVNENYSKYHECRVAVDSWIEWYKTQKEIYNK